MKCSMLATGLMLIAAPAMAGLSHAPGTGSGGTVSPGVEHSAPLTISQNATTNIVDLNSVACNAGGLTTDNSYWRSFNLGSLSAPFQVQSVTFGVETVIGAAQTLQIRLHRDTDTNPGNGGLTLVSSTTYMVDSSMGLSLQTAAIGGLFNPGDNMVLEIFSANGQATGQGFFIGSNSDGQTGASYIAAADCGIASPTSLASIGFPGMHVVMFVNGKLVPTPGAAAVLGLAGLAGLRRRR